MKKIHNFPVIFILFTFILTSCHSGYEVDNGKVYYKWIHGGNWTLEKTLIKEADAATFTTIKNNLNVDLGKDKNHVFKDSALLTYADPNTFEQVYKYYWKDKNNVYLIQFGNTDCRIKSADPESFVIIKDNHWAKDNNNIYFQFKKLKDIDPNTFIVIDTDWGKDNNHYYYHELRLDSLDYNSAEIINSYYIKDQNYVFFENKIVKGANPKTFIPDGIGWFGHDDKNMYDEDENKGPITETYKHTYIDK